MNKISIIVPCYNEDAALPIYYKEMCKIMAQMKEEEFELIFVDDGSTDHTLAEMKGVSIFLFQEISEKKRQSMQDLKMPRESMRQLWMWICRIRRHCCQRCMRFYRQKIMTVWQRGVLQEVESRRSVPFYLKAFTNLLTVFPKQRL